MDKILVVLLAPLFFILPLILLIFRGLLNKRESSRPPRRIYSTDNRNARSQPATYIPQQTPPLIREGPDQYSWYPPPIPEYVPDPFNYQAKWWRKYSHWYRKEKNWTCEACWLSLNEDRNFLHTHHIWGVHFNEPEDLKALCIGCHSEQPGKNHANLKQTPDYKLFLQKYGRKWKLHRIH